MVLYSCHSDTTKCRAYDQTGAEYVLSWYGWDKWRIRTASFMLLNMIVFPIQGSGIDLYTRI